ncbi:MAG: acyl-CoA thioesterase [Planctomycetota bacterium]
MREFSTTLRVRYAEVDRMGAVNSARYFEWFELARSNALREMGLPYGGLEERGIFAPVVEAGCQYLARIGYDEVVTIATSLEVLSPVRLRFHFQVFRGEGEGKVFAAEGFTENAIVDGDGRPKRLSGDLRALLAAQ